MRDRPMPPLAVSMGEPAGVGPDLLLRLYAERDAHGLPPFIVFGHVEFLRARADRLGLAVDIASVPPEDAETAFPEALPIVAIEGLVPDRPGETSHLSAPVVIRAIDEATSATLRGACRALVTAPINKGILYAAGFRYPGHTEYLAALTTSGPLVKAPVMMLVHEDLRVVPLTVHVPLAEVPRLVTAELIAATARTLAHDLRTRFAVPQPKIGVAGLNPHAGETGGIGREELDVIAPAVAELQFDGMDIDGPFPADTLFYPPFWRRFDAIIAMYHDQALIPIKTVAFDAAVNVTLGLPIIRTSPDHGTAFNLAGTGKASPASLLAALRLADRLAAEPQ
jgi:4-hydroxythreonine-4-phosphate dehydrogenase